MDHERKTPPDAPKEIRDELVILADETFRLTGDVHHLVTFLNRTLKDDGYIFGLRLAENDRYRLTIYRT